MHLAVAAQRARLPRHQEHDLNHPIPRVDADRPPQRLEVSSRGTSTGSEMLGPPLATHVASPHLEREADPATVQQCSGGRNPSRTPCGRTTCRLRRSLTEPGRLRPRLLRPPPGAGEYCTVTTSRPSRSPARRHTDPQHPHVDGVGSGPRPQPLGCAEAPRTHPPRPSAPPPDEQRREHPPPSPASPEHAAPARPESPGRPHAPSAAPPASSGPPGPGARPHPPPGTAPGPRPTRPRSDLSRPRPLAPPPSKGALLPLQWVRSTAVE